MRPLAYKALPRAILLSLSVAAITADETAHAAVPRLSCDEEPECAHLAAAAYAAATAGRLAEAQRGYEQAYKNSADPRLLFNLGRVVHRAGHPDQAIAYYQQYLAAKLPDEEPQQNKARRFLQQARRESSESKTPPVLLSNALGQRPEPPAEPAATPLYRKWWLWTAVGAAAASIAIGLGVGLAAARPDLSNATEIRPYAN